MHVSRAIVIVRHPIDCLLAYYSYLKKGHTNTPTEIHNKKQMAGKVFL